MDGISRQCIVLLNLSLLLIALRVNPALLKDRHWDFLKIQALPEHLFDTRHHTVTPLESLLRLEPLVSDSPMPLQDIQPSPDVSRIPFYTILHTSQSIVHPISLSILITQPTVEKFI